MRVRSKGEQGYTLVEVMISASILAVIISVAFQTLFVAQRDWAVSSKESIAAQNDSVALKVLTTTLRAAQAPALTTSAIEIASPAEMQFYADADGDGKPERVHYVLSDDRLQVGIMKPTSGPPWSYTGGTETQSVIAPNMANSTSNPLFTYYRSGETTSFTPVSQSDRDLIALIKITPLSNLLGGGLVQLESDVAPRHLKFQQ